MLCTLYSVLALVGLEKVGHSPTLNFCVCVFPPLKYWREISKFTLTFNVKFSRNYWRLDTRNINGKCASGTRYSLHASGRTFSLNLFKCIYSDYTDSKQTREHLEKLVGSSGSLGLCCFHSSENTGEISALACSGACTNSESMFGSFVCTA